MMSPIYWLINASGIGIGVGAASTVAYHLGEGDRERASTLASNALFLGLIASVVASALMTVLIGPIISLLGAEDIRNECISYVLPFILLASALIINGVISGLLRAEGAGRKSMTMMLMAAGLNMVLDPVLIYGLDLGVSGAGWATSIGALLSVCLGLYWYVKGRMEIRIQFRGFRPDMSSMREVSGIAGPRTAEALITGTTNIFQRIFIVAAGGTMAVMVYNVPFRYSSLIVVVAEAIGAALIPVCSAALGQNDVGKMRTGMRYSAKLSFGITLVLSAGVFVFAEPLMGIFTVSDSMAEHKDELVWVCRMFCIFTPFDGLRKLGSCMLQVFRRSKESSVAMLLWGLTKLGVYAITCRYSFEALIIGCVGVYIFGGLLMMGLAWLYGRRTGGANPWSPA